MLRKYITKNGKVLRYGYTTGSCATAAAKACGIMLLTGIPVNSVTLITPSKVELILKVHDIKINENTVSCAIEKDSGDDPDITNGMWIYATVSKTDTKLVEITGGNGIGKVTKAGLDQEVGQSAINSVPRKTIEQALNQVSEDYNYSGGFKVVISAPQGEELSKKTYNSRLGIIGGLSILGTTGIVEPMSESAIVDTIYAEINVKHSQGEEYLLITPGNYGQDFIKNSYELDPCVAVKCSNFIGEAIDYAFEKGFKGILIIGHAGKIVKLAAGLFNTHSKFGDARGEIIASYAAIFGASGEIIEKILNSATVDQMILELKQLNIEEQVLEKVMQRIYFNINARVYNSMKIEAIVFTDKLGIIGNTPKAFELLSEIGRK